MEREGYLAELEIARDPTDARHAVPPPQAASCKVLDVGCGAGQTLIAVYSDRVSFGIDVDFEALRFGRSLAAQIRFCQSRAEALPFKSQQFDLVFSRVALPYTNMRRALEEIHRVLGHDGHLWATLHTPAMRWRRAKETWKGRCFFVYIALNTLLFHLAQRQFSFFGRYECCQTETGMRRALQRFGFSEVEVAKRNELFLITAKRDP